MRRSVHADFACELVEFNGEGNHVHFLQEHARMELERAVSRAQQRIRFLRKA